MDEKYILANGVEIPKIGLGTWFIQGDAAKRVVKDAVEAGYRLIDTAQAYDNEEELGESIRNCGISREELFITSKVAAEHKSYQAAYDSTLESIRKLGLDYIDMMLIHSPEPWAEWRGGDHYFEGNVEAWRALEDLYKDGKIRAIGVSNFEKVDLDNIFEHCEIRPMVNQVLAHISNTPMELIKYSQDNGLLVEAYSPIAHGEILDNSEVKAIAEKYGVSVSQVCIKYTLQLGLLPLPKTANPEHMKSNIDLDFDISDEDMETLKNIQEISGYGEHSYFPVFSMKKD